MSTEPELTFEQYQDAMIEYAKEVQGDNYAGDDYYRQDCWLGNWEDGVSSDDSVDEDTTYWEE